MRPCLVWLARIITGLTFVVSGWAKAIDPWGFVIKTGEYLSVWAWNIPHEAIVAGCITLACVEFCTGVLLLTGCLKRVSVWVAAVIMAFMLPLTLYIFIADPVSDCGCFGDFIVLSNGATFAKNVLLSALIVYLFKTNSSVSGIYAAPVQWLVITASAAFPLLLALGGYQIQPLVDFRPYTLGTRIFASTGEADAEEYIYEKNGRQQSFGLDALPDSTWTFVDIRQIPSSGYDGGIAVYDNEGYDVSADIINDDGAQLFLIIPEPSIHYLTFAHYITGLSRYCRENDIDMTAVIGDSARLSRWYDWVRPDFDIYTADPTALKQLVRGPEALVFTLNGNIVWKRTLSSMPPELPDSDDPNALASLNPVDNGNIHLAACAIYLAAMLLIYFLSLSPKILIFFMRRNK